MIRKIYNLENGMTWGRLSTKFCGVTINMEFKGGSKTPKVKASLETGSKFVQDAIENDPRFGTLFTLAHTYGEEEQKPAEETVEEVVEEAPKAKKAVKSKKEKTLMDIEEVKSVNDVERFFEERGEEVSGDEDIERLTEKYGVTFPNLKK